jgi:hypothetical protein
LTIQSEPIKNKGAELRNALLQLEHGVLRSDFYFSPPVPVKVKRNKDGENEWINLKIVRVSTNCFVSETITLPFWAVLDYRLKEA